MTLSPTTVASFPYREILHRSAQQCSTVEESAVKLPLHHTSVLHPPTRMPSFCRSLCRHIPRPCKHNHLADMFHTPQKQNISCVSRLLLHSSNCFQHSFGCTHMPKLRTGVIDHENTPLVRMCKRCYLLQPRTHEPPRRNLVAQDE